MEIAVAEIMGFQALLLFVSKLPCGSQIHLESNSICLVRWLLGSCEAPCLLTRQVSEMRCLLFYARLSYSITIAWIAMGENSFSDTLALKTADLQIRQPWTDEPTFELLELLWNQHIILPSFEIAPTSFA